jgi:predicted ATPase/DNA-binding XRE family transcriptional regulator/tetratricopeptide (TPR) repeat protein
VDETPNVVAFTTFGELLRHLRKRAGMTQRDLGQAVGYSEAHIARLESGIRLPDVAVVKGAFVEALDLSHELAIATQLVTLAQATHAAEPPVHTPSIGNLPTPATRLIGREQDVVAITHHLFGAETRLVTLVGIGGVGKTRLALEVAQQMQDRFLDGAWWVDLAAVVEPHAALASMAQSLGIDDRSGKPVLRVLQDYLRGRCVLLVLDNLEQVLDVAPLISQVLSTAPRLKVLATSRELMRIAGEQAFTVNPLGDAAVELFVLRAKAVKQDFALNAASAATISAICRRLDGLPLAIELAAARILLFTPQEMLDRLDHSLSLLTGGARDLPARQRTLRAALDWSYNLLAPDEQVLFRRLGVFAGGCTLHAVQALLDAGGDLTLTAEEGLSALVAKCLLVRDAANHNHAANPFYFEHEQPAAAEAPIVGASRYRMLETVRAYACELMQERGEFDKWVRVMARYLLDLHKQVKHALPGERENCMTVLQWLNATHDNTGLSLQLAMESSAFTISVDEEIGCMTQAIRHAGLPEDAEQVVWAKAVCGTLIGLRGDRAQAITMLENSLAWYESHGIRTHAVQEMLHALGHQNRELGCFEQSRRYFFQSLLIAEEHGDTTNEQRILISMAENEVAAENAAEAIHLLDKAEVAPAPMDDLMRAWAFNHRAHAAMLAGDLDKAESLLRESNGIFSQGQYQGEWGMTWNSESAGEISLMRGDVAQAKTCFEASLALFERVGDRMGMSWSLCGLAGACALNKEAKRGAQLWGAGEALRQKIGCRIAPASRTNRERTTALLKTQLGEAEFAQLEAEGAAWTPEQAVDVALGTTPEKRRDPAYVRGLFVPGLDGAHL